MKNKSLSLGIDTSNYKTSVAVVDDEGNIVFNNQTFLDVKLGERGLRQSDAFFQHVKKLPGIFEEVFSIEGVRKNIGCVAVSTRPRPVEGSYMPVFMAGHSFARSLASTLDVPLYKFSHQEGHVEAVKFYSPLKDTSRFISFHFSGGTTEALLIDEDNNTFEIVGGSKDLAYGQVIDRVGVSMGLEFPCGEAMDKIALSQLNKLLAKKGNTKRKGKGLFAKIKSKDCFVNLSGIETQAQRALEVLQEIENEYHEASPDNDLNSWEDKHDQIVEQLFYELSRSIAQLTFEISQKYDIKNFMFAGGVSSSQYMRQYIKDNLPKDINLVFGASKLSQDNAIGIALLGGKSLWR